MSGIAQQNRNNNIAYHMPPHWSTHTLPNSGYVFILGVAPLHALANGFVITPTISFAQAFQLASWPGPYTRAVRAGREREQDYGGTRNKTTGEHGTPWWAPGYEASLSACFQCRYPQPWWIIHWRRFKLCKQDANAPKKLGYFMPF